MQTLRPLQEGSNSIEPRSTPPTSFGAIATVEEWDGKDGELPEEEPLDAYDDEEVAFGA